MQSMSEMDACLAGEMTAVPLAGRNPVLLSRGIAASTVHRMDVEADGFPSPMLVRGAVPGYLQGINI